MKWLFLLLFSFQLNASELAYVKTDNPRDTMETFTSAMNDYRSGVKKDDSHLKSRILDAIRCFSDKEGAVVSSLHEKELAAIFLKETIDRAIVIDLSKIPDNQTLPSNRWRLKNTEITLRQVKEGEREGEWLFTQGTWKRAKQFYTRTKKQPYLKGSGQGALYVQPWVDELLPEWAKKELFSLKSWQWLGIIFGFILGLILKFLCQFFITLIVRVNFPKKIAWKRQLILEIQKPLGLLVASLVWYLWASNLSLEGLSFSLVNGFIQIVFGIGLTWAVYKCVGVFGSYLRSVASKTASSLDDQLVPFVEKTLKLLVIILGFLVVLQNMGLNVFSLLAGLGLGGLAFALAAKDTAANLFGSIMILIDRPFKIGDWVKVGSTEGTVEEVGFRSTRVRTFYNSLITVPNANMANAQIDNMGERSSRRTSVTLDITYDTHPDQIEKFISGIEDILSKNEFTKKDVYHVYFSGYAASSLQIMLYFFLETKDWSIELQERQNIYLDIYKLADSLNVEFAFPTQTLYLNNQDQPSHP